MCSGQANEVDRILDKYADMLGPDPDLIGTKKTRKQWLKRISLLLLSASESKPTSNFTGLSGGIKDQSLVSVLKKLCGGWKPRWQDIDSLPGGPFSSMEMRVIKIAWLGIRWSSGSVLPAIEYLIAREKERSDLESKNREQGLSEGKSE